MELRSLPLDRQSYGEYGDTIAALCGDDFVSVNMGTAKRYNWRTDLRNLRSGTARLNICVFSCSPWQGPYIEIGLLERHPFSAQMFSPLGSVTRYLAVVAGGSNRPDLNSLRAFIVSGQQGISYKPGIWHHPLICLDRPGDFLCAVWEDGSSGDCEVHNLQQNIRIEVP